MSKGTSWPRRVCVLHQPALGILEERDGGSSTRIGKNEALLREVNEQINVLNTVGAQASSFPAVCECGALTCAEVVPVAQVTMRPSCTSRPLLDQAGPPDRRPGGRGRGARGLGGCRQEGGNATTRRPGKRPPPMSSLPTDPEIARRIGENEARFRDANERIEAAAEQLEPQALMMPFVCECGRPNASRRYDSRSRSMNSLDKGQRPSSASRATSSPARTSATSFRKPTGS